MNIAYGVWRRFHQAKQIKIRFGVIFLYLCRLIKKDL